MIRNLYSIRDVKINELLNVVVLKNEAEAHRWFIMAVCDQRGPVAKAPKDYNMLHLGTIDTETGAIVPIGIPRDCTPHTAVDQIIARIEHGSQGKHQDQGGTGNPG